MREKKETQLAAQRARTSIMVRILTGSEKEKFLSDADLAKVLAAEGIAITVQKAGSREIATRSDLKSFDIAYPAGAHAAVKIAQNTGSKRTYATFYTPMAVASWKSLIPVLENSGLVSRRDGVFYISDMAKLVDMMQKATRWKNLPGNTAYAVGKSILVSSTDVRKSNSGGMYLALAAYIANGNNVVDNEARIQGTLGELLPRLQELRDRGIISAKDWFTVFETVRRYLPDTLAAYLRLPKFYAQMQTLADGRTATQTLLDQLRMLDTSLKEIAKNAFAGDAEALVSNGQFLAKQIRRKTGIPALTPVEQRHARPLPTCAVCEIANTPPAPPDDPSESRPPHDR